RPGVRDHPDAGVQTAEPDHASAARADRLTATADPSGSDRHGLGWSAPGSLARDDPPLVKQLTAPDTPGFAAFERAGETLRSHRAAPAYLLGQLDPGGRVGEEQVRIFGPAR